MLVLSRKSSRIEEESNHKHSNKTLSYGDRTSNSDEKDKDHRKYITLIRFISVIHAKNPLHTVSFSGSLYPRARSWSRDLRIWRMWSCPGYANELSKPCAKVKYWIIWEETTRYIKSQSCFAPNHGRLAPRDAECQTHWRHSVSWEAPSVSEVIALVSISLHCRERALITSQQARRQTGTAVGKVCHAFFLFFFAEGWGLEWGW